MNRWTVLLVAMVFVTLVTLGCSNGGSNPVVPTDGTDLTVSSQGSTQNATTYLWGYYDVTIDLATQSITAVPDRTTMFVANVVEFLNGNPAAMIFTMNNLEIGSDTIIVDIDVGISHPFSGMPQFNGYDVKGVFMGNGSETMSYDSQLDYPVYGTDQYMLDDPAEDDGGGPDGYTRWFNATEFNTSGMFGYIEGDMASKGYLPNATVSPYRYYADGIGNDEEVFDFLTANASDYGIFASGETNTRNYYLEFPVPMPSALYGYAVIASWEDPDIHPANAPEAQALSVTITPDVYFVDGTDKGGDLVLEFDVWSWEDQPTAIWIESGVLLSAYELTPAEMTPVGGGANYSTYEVEVPADNIQFNSGTDGDSDYWIICEAGAYDYKNDGFNPTGPSDTLAGFFRYPLFIADEPYNLDPVCEVTCDDTMPYDGWGKAFGFDASTSYDPEGETLTFEWDFDDDGTFGDPYEGGTDDHPFKVFNDDYVGDVCVKVTDGTGGESICCVAIDITAVPAKNIDVSHSIAATDIAMDNTNGDILIYYGPLGQVRRYTISSFYQTYSTMYVVGHTNAIYIATNDIGDFLVTYYDGGSSIRFYFYNPNGGLIRGSGHGFGPPPTGICDNVAYPNTGYRPNAMGVYIDWRINSTFWYTYSHIRYGSTYASAWYPANYSNPTSPPNPSYLKSGYIVGVEADQDGNNWWALHETEFYVNRRYTSNSSYSNAYFGTAGTDGDDDSHLAGPLDITKDDDNTFYILDEQSTGDFVIKGFTVSGNTTTPITSFGSSADWAYDPIRIDGSNFNNFLTVLQTDGSDSYISVFPQ